MYGLKEKYKQNWTTAPEQEQIEKISYKCFKYVLDIIDGKTDKSKVLKKEVNLKLCFNEI